MSAETEGDGVVSARPGMDAVFARSDYVLKRSPVRRVFQPWHKPRKQYVREQQWATEVSYLLSNRQDDREPLRYLGLPGVDFLDIRYLYEKFCSGSGFGLRFLGFDESAAPTSRDREAHNISLQEVRALGKVDPRSDVRPDNFRSLATKLSISWDAVGVLGPFDVVNLDLCGHFGKDRALLDGSIYNAIHRLWGRQLDLREWSLFLTTRLGSDGISTDTLTAMLARLKSNQESCQSFADGISANFGQVIFEQSAVAGWSQSEFSRLMTIGILKWLLAFAQMSHCLLSVESVVGYRVHRAAEDPDMVSLVIRVQRILDIGPDPVGLASIGSTMPSECSQAAPLPVAVASLIDVDEYLDRDPAQWDYFKSESAALLERASASYQPDAYNTWAEDGRR